MKKIKSLFLLLFVFLFFQSCATIKEGFSSQKKKSTEEWRDEKKSPLVTTQRKKEIKERKQ
mgnify:CR=1 FL=1